MTTEQKLIAGLPFHKDKPTRVSFQKLNTWVVWQFPLPYSNGMMGAVHPPIPKHQWYPAVVQPMNEEVVVHAHVETAYETPETAVTYFNN